MSKGLAYSTVLACGGYQTIETILALEPISSFLAKLIKDDFDTIMQRHSKLNYFIGLLLIQERLPVGDALYQITKYPNQTKAHEFALNEMGLEIAPRTSESDIKELHQAILAENIEKIKALLTESNCDLKGPNGMTPMQLIFDKYKSQFEQVKLKL